MPQGVEVRPPYSFFLPLQWGSYVFQGAYKPPQPPANFFLAVIFAASVHTLITKQPVPSPPSSCTPTLTIATHFTATYLTPNLTFFNTSKVLSHVLSSVPPKSSHINPVVKYLHFLKITQLKRMTREAGIVNLFSLHPIPDPNQHFRLALSTGHDCLLSSWLRHCPHLFYCLSLDKLME